MKTRHALRSRLTALAACSILCVLALSALGQSGIKIRGEGAVDYVPDGVSTFFLDGTASHLGVYRCDGELDIHPGAEEGSLEGTGVAAFKSANGDMLVGVVTYHSSASGEGDFHFSWRDSIQFSDGTVARSTGRFEDHRPPGLIIRYKVVCILNYCFIFIS